MPSPGRWRPDDQPSYVRRARRHPRHSPGLPPPRRPPAHQNRAPPSHQRRPRAATLVPVRRALAGQTVTARTLDFADDELPPFLAEGARGIKGAEGREGGRLGRGLPLMLAQPDALTDQFRSLLGAAAETDLRIMILALTEPG